ncbi:MAG: hypothetical protein NQU46_06655 [Methanolinea sp.]|nr:hypothetical protein [Methanolinea sp.]
MTTVATDRFVGSSVLKPVTTGYTVDLSGIGTASAFMRSRFMSGASPAYNSLSGSYFEQTTASGTILKFSKSFSYISGVQS